MEPSNFVDCELELRAVTLRNFRFRLLPIRPLPALSPGYDAAELAAAAEGAAVDGLELECVARDTGLKVSLRFERSEFVNVATAGLAMLDAADAAEIPKGGD